MYTTNDAPSEFEALSYRCRELLEEIISQLPLVPESFKLRSEVPLFSIAQPGEHVYVLKEGNLAFAVKGRTLFYYQEGDLIGFEHGMNYLAPAISSEFATVLERYPTSQFFDSVEADENLRPLWREFFGTYLSAVYVMLRNQFKDQEPVVPEVRSYPQGTIIIEQGSMSTEVYTMADGSANVEVDGVTVGKINTDEIFGAFAAFTDTARIATVIAETDCLVLALPKDSFLDLITSRPTVVQKMVHDMAKTIVSMNKQIVSQSMKL